MTKQKRKYAKCPSCSIEKHRTEMTVCISILEKIERKQYPHYNELDLDSYNSFINSNFEWACDNCLKDKKAIIANPGLQIHPWTPHLAYHDAGLVCRNCGIAFKFTKEEKKLWYEKLKFWIDAEPANCLKCRRQMRQLKAENKTLSAILRKNENEISIDELKVVADIYRKWNKVEKAKFYESIVRKKQRI